MYAAPAADLVFFHHLGAEHGTYVSKASSHRSGRPQLTDGRHHIGGELAAQSPDRLRSYSWPSGRRHGSHRPGAPLAVPASDPRRRALVVQLKVGDPVYLNDILETGTGAKLGLVLLDGPPRWLGEKATWSSTSWCTTRPTHAQRGSASGAGC